MNGGKRMQLFPPMMHKASSADPLSLQSMRQNAIDATIAWRSDGRPPVSGDYESYMSSVRGHFGDDPMDTLHHFCLFWAQAGFPTFELTGGLASALMLTQCIGLRGSDLRFPFGAFAIQMPFPSPLLYPRGGVRRILVSDWRAAGVRFISIEAATESHNRRFVLKAPHDTEALSEWVRRASSEAEFASMAGPPTFTFLVNFAAYVGSLGSLPAASGKRNRENGGIPDAIHSPPLRWVLGREIKLSKQIYNAAAAYSSSEGTAAEREKYRLQTRFVVRGHWRNQACGKERLERKRVWIAPFWKGPTMADGLTRLYSVSEKAQ